MAVDERAHPSTTAACATLADRVFVVPAAMQHMERYLGWLHGTCSCEWILRVDDDELPGATLRDALPALLAEREPTHYWLPRAWMHPTPDTQIDEGTWQRDIQVRLVRNLPGLWRFTGRVHSNIEVTGAGRVLDTPLLHLALLVADLDERRAKAERYERVMPGLIDESGLSVNSVFVPEDVGVTALAPTTVSDAATATAFLEASASPPPASTKAAAQRVGAEEIWRFNTERTVSAGAYRARVRVLHAFASMPAESLRHVQVEITNLGDEWWPRGPVPGPPIQVGHRWWDEEGEEIIMATPRAPFTETVPPGATTRVTIAIQAPSVTGRLGLRVDVVHENVRWFECEERLTVEVTPAYTEGFFAAHDVGARESARVVLPRLLALSTPRSVVDVGCGTGTWLAVARELGIEDVLGLDGEWVRPEALEIPADRFRAVDLATASTLDRRFDLALSLEVAAHLPLAAAERFVGLIVSAAPLVAFSAAVPGQGGASHVSEQWPRFWADRFAARGYEVVDLLREQLWEDERIEWWYRQNLLLFGAPDALDGIAELREHPRRGVPPLALVHPRRLSPGT